MGSRTRNKLSAKTVEASKLKPGRHSDGGNLYLNVSKTGTKSWVFMWDHHGRRREMGLGPYPDVTLERARGKAQDCRQKVREGLDPIAERGRQIRKTFGECCDELIDAQRKGWKNEKHIAQWEMTLSHYCKPIHNKQVADIDTADVLSILQPIWTTKNETASRLRGRIERVLTYAKVQGYRTGENPALWRDHLSLLLPKRHKLQKGHHPAMPYADVPAFMARLRGTGGVGAKALELTILSALRSAEVYQARWSEFEFETASWWVPGERMKSSVVHRVPLSERAMELLADLRETRCSEYVFPGLKPGRPISSGTMTKVLKDLGAGEYTVHGFRSSFTDWIGEETNFPEKLAEVALGHIVGDDTLQAYRRGDAFRKRTKLMQAWARYCGGSQKRANVVEFDIRRAS